MDRSPRRAPLGYLDLVWIFFKVGLTFGGGISITGLLEDELVRKRQVVSRHDFMALFGIARVVPSGSMTALAVAYGYRFAGLPGTACALIGLILPAFALTIALTIGYGYVVNSPLLEVLPISLLPAALGLIVISALRLGRDVFRPSADLLVAAGAFVGAVVFDLNPAMLLLLGGVLGVLVLGRDARARS